MADNRRVRASGVHAMTDSEQGARAPSTDVSTADYWDAYVFGKRGVDSR
jgi:hypothetical protein